MIFHNILYACIMIFHSFTLDIPGPKSPSSTKPATQAQLAITVWPLPATILFQEILKWNTKLQKRKKIRVSFKKEQSYSTALHGYVLHGKPKKRLSISTPKKIPAWASEPIDHPKSLSQVIFEMTHDLGGQKPF